MSDKSKLLETSGGVILGAFLGAFVSRWVDKLMVDLSVINVVTLVGAAVSLFFIVVMSYYMITAESSDKKAMFAWKAAAVWFVLALFFLFIINNIQVFFLSIFLVAFYSCYFLWYLCTKKE